MIVPLHAQQFARRRLVAEMPFYALSDFVFVVYSLGEENHHHFADIFGGATPAMKAATEANVVVD
ncbi:hypothetical protein CYK37_20695 [Mesorhizobium loti]|nr:hypothetical protein CYK37_20695 [Mesorhizobium loti]